MSQRALLSLSLAVAVAGFSQTAAAQDINLHCKGSGVHKESKTSLVNNGLVGEEDHSVSTVQSTSKTSFEGSVDVKIGTGFAKLRPPKELLPKLNSTDDDGWLQIEELKMTDEEISGEVSFNMLNSPDITISRITGDITISGSGGNFEGECTAIDPNAAPKF